MPTSQPPDDVAATRPAPADAAPASRAVPAAILLLALGGLGIALYLWHIYHQVRSGGGSSFCDLTERWSCSDVARSPRAAFLGVPQAGWGALSYLTVAGLAISMMIRRRPGSWPAGILVVTTGFMAAWSVYLAFVSEVVLKKFCIMCASSWSITLLLLVISVLLARRAGGVAAALRADFRTLADAPAASLSAGVVLAAAAVALLVGYAVAPPEPPPAEHRSVIPVGAPGSLVVYEFSDYLCPFCAAIHAKEKEIVARRPDLRLVRRFFPLDATCNPAVHRTVHEGACDLARGGICAEKQGRFEAYDDAAFTRQAEHPSPEEVAADVGLDLPAFRACLTSPETQQRLAADARSGVQANVDGTPAFLVQGKVESARAFLELLGLSGQITP